MKKPLGILFDLGDTVLEYTKNIPIEGTKKIVEVSDNPKGISVEEIQDLAINLTKETFDKRDAHNLEINFKSFQNLLYESFGIRFKLAANEIEKIFCKYAYEARPSEGIEDLFKTLDLLDIKYAALSNSSFTQSTLKYELEEYGLYPNFEFILSSCDYCIRKPNKIIFDLAQRKLDVDPENIWFIGDSYKYDIEGSKNAGMQPIWYNSKNRPNPGKINCIEVKRVSEITEMIKNIYKI